MLPDSSEGKGGSSFEPSSLESSIHTSNVGFQMLQKMGWNEDKGLGKEGKGITAPVSASLHTGSVGLGKDEEDNKALQEVTRERKKLDLEIEHNEETIQQRIENAERLDKIETDIKTMHKEFFCEICSKQYVNVQEVSCINSFPCSLCYFSLC